ncbi:MAG: PAS domain-containing protein [Gemmatimonadales bacterium]
MGPGTSQLATGDRDERRREFLSPLVSIVFFVSLLGGVVAYLIGIIELRRLLIDLGIALIAGGVPLALLRLGRVRQSVAVVLAAPFVAIGWLAWTGGGLSAHLAIYQLLYLILASFLVTRQRAYLLALAVTTLDLFLVLADTRGWLPPSAVQASGAFTVFVLATSSGFAVAMITRFVGSLEDALGRSHAALETRDAAEAELIRSNREYQQLVGLVPGIVFRFREAPDGSYQFPFISDGVERITGRTATSIMTDASLAIEAALPEARPELKASIDAAVRDRGAWLHEFPVRGGDGSVRWIRGHSTPTGVDADGCCNWHGVLLDITDRRVAETQQQVVQERLVESEERFRSLAASIPEVFWVLDVPGGFVYVSPAAKTVWDIEPADALADPYIWLPTVHPDDRDHVLRKIEHWVRSGETGPYEVAFRRLCADGSVRHLESRITLRQLLPDGRLRVGGVVADVTARRKAEADAREAERQRYQSQKLEALGTLAGGIAHDFNNLLAVITGYADLARHEVPAAAPLMDPVMVAGQRARDLVRRILLFSRPSGEERRPVRVKHLVDEVVGLLRATLPRSITISVTSLSDDAVILADASQVSQALMNLGVNAGQAMPESGGRIVVSLSSATLAGEEAVKRHLEPGPYVMVRVVDNGAGMSADVAARVFEPFFTTKPTGQGTGLGLSVVHSIVHNHGGTITVDSQVGKGTAVTVWLPLVADPAPSRSDRDRASDPFGGQRLILVVEDQVPVLSVTRAMVERLGFKAEAYSDPTLAAAAFAADPSGYAAVLSDRSMPSMSGIDLARRVASAGADTPFILMTGYEGGIQRSVLEEASIADLLPKPVRLADLAQCLRRHLGPTEAVV